MNSLEKKHQNRLQDDLELFRKQQNKLEVEKTKLSENVAVHIATIQEEDDATTKLKQALGKLQAQLDTARNSLDEEKKKAVHSNTATTQLEQSLKAKDTEVDKLKESLSNRKTKVSKFRSQVQDIQKENTSPKEKLQAKTERLGEFGGFGVNLHKEDEEIW
jgi:chromosome segregation ATPase